jgi:hypothetical protein
MRSSIVLILALAAPAAASPDHGYMGGGAALTLDHFLNAYLDVEGAVRPSVEAPLWLRGSFAYGADVDVEGGGRFLQIRGGVETRTCSSSGSCLFLGVDIGRQNQTWHKIDEMTEHHSGWVYGPRFGIDVGGEQTRFRLAIESYRYARSSDVDGDRAETEYGAGIGLAVVHRM